VQAACAGGAAREDDEVPRVVPRAASATARERLARPQRPWSRTHHYGLGQRDSIVPVVMAVMSMSVITPVPMIGVRAIGVATDPRRQRTGRGLAEAVRARRWVRAVVWQALRERSGRPADDHCQCQNKSSHRSISAWRPREAIPESEERRCSSPRDLNLKRIDTGKRSGTTVGAIITRSRICDQRAERRRNAFSASVVTENNPPNIMKINTGFGPR
jgi:hypothetical protein